MSEARIVLIAGSVVAASVATWLATMFYTRLMAIGSHVYPADADVWWWIGVPFAFSIGVAASIVTRRAIWLPSCWSLATLSFFALRVLFVAILVCAALMILLGFVMALLLAGVPLHGSGRGVPEDIGSVVLGALLAMTVIGEMFVLLLARWTATRIEHESKRIEE